MYHTINQRLRALAVRISVAAVAAAAVFAATATVGGSAAAAAPAPKPASSKPVAQPVTPVVPASVAAQRTASQQAKSAGTPVVVTSLTTEKSQITANPDGSFTMSSNAIPVRMQRAGAWVPINTDLVANPDGTWAPRAALLGVTFSGGGSGAMLTVNSPTSTGTPRSLSLYWPTALPTPVVTGNTALYPSVLPGVDLRLAASTDSYSEVLIVHDAAAAADPQLAALKLRVEADNLTLAKTATGALTATAADGSTVFAGAAPTMWDSTTVGKAGPAPSADSPGTGRQSRLGVAVGPVARTPATGASTPAGVTSTEVTLTPPAATLTGKVDKFPLFIDPTFSTNTVSKDWLDVQSNGWTWWGGTGEHDNPDDITTARVGDCDLPIESGCGWVDRTYFEMNTSAFAKANGTTAKVSSASFTINEIWGANACTKQPVDLYGSGAISSSTLWAGPETGSALNEQTSAGGTNCSSAPEGVSFSSTALTNYVQTAATNGATNDTFVLRAPSETNDYQWKQFAPTSATLNVTYDFPPNTPTGLTVSNLETCNGVNYTSASIPSLTATATDNNPSPTPYLNFQLLKAGTVVAATTSGIQVGNGSAKSWTETGGALTNATAYSFQARTDNEPGNANDRFSAWSAAYNFTVLSSPPVTAPSVHSSDFPASFWGQPANTGGQFAVSSPDPDLQGFRFSLTGSQVAADATKCDTTPTQLSNTSSGLLTDGFVAAKSGVAGIAIAPGNLAPGFHTLTVGAVDYAGNSGPNTTYAFYVAPGYATGVPAGNTTNLAWQAPVTVSSTVNTNWPAANLTDGDTGGLLFGWSSEADTAAANVEWVYVDLGSAKNIDDVVLTPREDSTANIASGFPTAFLIQTSTDASTWTTVDTLANYPAPGASGQQFTFPETSARYVRVYATALTTDSIGTSYYLQLKQFAVYDKVGFNRYEGEDPGFFTASATGTGGWTSIQSFGTNWSQGSQLYFNGTAAGNVDTIKFTASASNYYALGANMGMADDYGQVTFSLNYTVGGNPVSIPLTANGNPFFDGYNASVYSAYVQLGGAYLTAGTQYTLTMTMTGTNSASITNRYNAGVDYVTMAQIASPTATSFAAALNNSGIAADGQSSSAAFDLGSNSLSQTDVADAGLTTASPVQVAGNYYQLGAASGNDNVIAVGQTIDITAPKAGSVSLLTASTCGGTSSGTVTVNYTNPATEPASQVTIGTAQGDIAPVPDWIEPAAGSVNPALTLAGYDKGTTKTHTVASIGLYQITVPTNPAYTIASITLPSYNITMLPGGCPTLLHVLAIGTPSTDSGPTEVLPGTSTTANWIGTWASVVDTNGAGAPAAVSPPAGTDFASANETVREVIHPSNDGTGSVIQTRIRLGDPNGASPVTFNAVSIAVETGTGAGTVSTPIPLTFNGSATLTLTPGTESYSDPVTLPALTAGQNLMISEYLPNAEALVPDHSNARTPGLTSASYYAAGNQTAATAGTWTAMNGWYYLTDVDMTTTDLQQGTVVVLGDQTALAVSPTTGTTWADDLPAALAGTSGVVTTNPGGIVNLSSTGATTTSALANLAGTVADEPNVRCVLVDVGRNDLIAGVSGDTVVADLGNLIGRLKTIQSPVAVTVDGTVGTGPIGVYLATVAPDAAITGTNESNRDALNSVILSSNGSIGSAGFDGYIDFDGAATMNNPGSPTDPSLLTGGVFNEAYFTTLAAMAVVPNDNYSTFPPIGSL